MIGVTPRAGAGTTSGLTTYTTAAFTPAASELLVACYSVANGASIDPNVPAVSGHGTWELIADHLWVPTGTTRRRMWVYAALTGISPSNAAVSFNHGVNGQSGAGWSIFGVSGTNAADGRGVASCFRNVTETVVGVTGTAGSLQIVGEPFNSESRAFSFWNEANTETMLPRPGWTEIHDVGHSAPSSDYQTQWRDDAWEADASASWTTLTSYGAIAFEIVPLVHYTASVMARGSIFGGQNVRRVGFEDDGKLRSITEQGGLIGKRRG